jgi:hypothetical protein
MENGSNDHGFMIPKSFLVQLGEYTRGYMLLACNEKGELFAHESYDNPVIKLGLIKFGDLHISAALEHMHNVALEHERIYDEDVDEEDGEDSQQD